VSDRVLVVGFDALDFEYLEKFADSMPAFGQLRSSGVEAGLESTHPPWTGSAWPSLYTGCDPSHHGVYDFFVHDDYPDAVSMASRNDVHKPALWNYLSAQGRPSVVMNVPVTHPVEPIEGVLVPGYLANEDAQGTPSSIREDLSDAIGEQYRIYSETETSSEGDAKLAGYLDLIRSRGRAADFLLREHEWEMAFVQVQKTDSVLHNFADEEAFRAIYEAADEFLATVMNVLDEDDTVVVCSDHGIGHRTGYSIYINEILSDHGFVEGSDSGEAKSLSSVKTELTGDAEGESARQGDDLLAGLANVVQTSLSRVGVTPLDVYRAADSVGLAETLVDILPTDVKSDVGEVVDWRASRAYCRSSTELGIRINLAGRDSDGVVPQDRYESVRDDLIELLRHLETPDGAPAFERVARREAVYDGPYVEDACDIVFVPHEMNHTIGTKLYGRRFKPVDCYDHERTGVFVAAGAGIEGGVDEMSLTAVAPLVMALLGQAVPERMTGSVPGSILAEPATRRDYGDVPYGTGRAEPTDDDEVTDRLEDLGYL
jgi:predicted AlkP superfamily phosphohydrolase/phosphomutase